MMKKKKLTIRSKLPSKQSVKKHAGINFRSNMFVYIVVFLFTVLILSNLAQFLIEKITQSMGNNFY